MEAEKNHTMTDLIVRKEAERCKGCAQFVELLPGLTILIEAQRNNPNATQKPPQNKNVSLEWRVKLSDLISACKNGCALCSFMLDKFFHNNKIWMWSYAPTKPWYADPEEKENRQQAIEHCEQILESLENDEFQVRTWPYHTRGLDLPEFNKLRLQFMRTDNQDDETTKRIFHQNYIDLHAFVSADDPAAGLISSRPPNASPGTDDGMKQAKQWLETCTHSHGSGCAPKPTKLPSRLIDVSNHDSLKLHISDGKAEGEYAALSYCWGTSQAFQTLFDTIQERINGFSFDQLPIALQDAVRVTQKLGLKYLWVDALCIIQDSVQDKIHELSVMADIYQNAYITICAAKSGSADEPFLDDWRDESSGHWRGLFPMSYPIPNKEAKSSDDIYQMPKDANGTVWLMEDSFQPYDLQQDPISKRGWALQERILSPRMLYYGKWPMWRCSKAVACDGGFLPAKNHFMDSGEGLLSRIFNEPEPFGALGKNMFMLNRLYENWTTIVQDYSHREITHPRDRLPAMAGMAQQFARVTGGEYAAGLWKNNLVHDLMWTCRGNERDKRPKEWRAPTWSWASIDSVISYEGITEDSIQAATAVSCEVTPLFPEAPFAEVKDGFVRIRGPFAQVDRANVEALLEKQGMGPAPPKSNDPMEWNAALFESFGFSLRDGKGPGEDEKAPVPDTVFALLLFHRNWTYDTYNKENVDRPSCCGILLDEVRPGHYERFAAFFNEDADWLINGINEWPSPEISLV